MTTTFSCAGSEPTIVTAPQNVSTISGQSARFQCEVSGAPKPVVTWTKRECTHCLLLLHSLCLSIVTNDVTST